MQLMVWCGAVLGKFPLNHVRFSIRMRYTLPDDVIKGKSTQQCKRRKGGDSSDETK